MISEEEISRNNEREDQDSDFQSDAESRAETLSEFPEPEFIDADQMENLPEPELENESADEYPRGFFRVKMPRWVIPVVAIAGIFVVAFVVGLIFKPNSLDKVRSDNASLLKPDSIKTASATSEHLNSGSDAGLAKTDIVNDIANITTGSNNNDPSLIAAENNKVISDSCNADQDSMGNKNIYEDIVMEPLKDEYYELLNAVITPDDNETIADSLFYDFLTEPIEPLPEDDLKHDRDVWTETDSTCGLSKIVSVDTTAIFERIYTLEDRMSELVGHLSMSESENRDLQAKIDRLKTAHDSLRAYEIKRLAKIIESMKPEKAAAMLNNRKSDLITELLFKLKPRTAARLMENLPVDKRSQVTGWVMQK